jgi:cytochrome P450
VKFPPDRAAEIVRHFDLRELDAAFYADPFPYYHALRELEPVKRLPDGSYFLTRYRDIQAVYRDAATFRSDKTVEFKPKYGDSPLYAHHTTSLVFNDPPRHTRVRRILSGALTVRAIAAMEPGLIRQVDSLLARIEARARRGETVDLIEDFASAIPVEIIGNLLDVPHTEREPLRAWSLAILGALEPALTPQQLAAGNTAVNDFLAYLKALIARRRAHPGDPQTDILTRLIEAEPGQAVAAGQHAGYERLSEDELLHNCIFILNAGHETTTNLIGNALVCLAQWPEQRELLKARPELASSAVEEFLRYESSNQLGNRMAAVDTVVGGMPIAAGTGLTLCIGAANRDPEQFPDPDRLDITREHSGQNARHLAFGFGIHQCAGMSLARLEGRVAISRFLERFPDYSLANEPVRSQRARFRGFVSVPCSVGKQV